MKTDRTYTGAPDVRSHLEELYRERAAASLEGLLSNGAYRSDLEFEIGATRDAYVGAAVTEIAVLRAAFHGRLEG